MIGKWIGQFFTTLFSTLRKELKWDRFRRTLRNALIGMFIFRYIMAANTKSDAFELFFWGFLIGILGSYVMRLIAYLLLKFLLGREEVLFEQMKSNTPT